MGVVRERRDGRVLLIFGYFTRRKENRSGSGYCVPRGVRGNWRKATGVGFVSSLHDLKEAKIPETGHYFFVDYMGEDPFFIRIKLHFYIIHDLLYMTETVRNTATPKQRQPTPALPDDQDYPAPIR